MLGTAINFDADENKFSDHEQRSLDLIARFIDELIDISY
jgi:phospholipase/carboxylesterase